MRRPMRRRGQSTTEYMLTISVISIAIIAVLIVFETVVTNGTKDVSQHLVTSLSDASNGGDPIQ
jgi:Flp pilus assembly pilin Flp